MKKHLCLFLLFTVSFIRISFAVDLNLEEGLGKKYKLSKEKDNLACFIPLAIKGIDTIYLKNEKDEIVYTIEIWGSEGSCHWEKDKILFTKGLSTSEREYILKNYKKKLYFDGNFRLMFRVKKILPTEFLSTKSIQIPYFILINNTLKNDIVFKKDLSIRIDLPKQGERIYKAESVSYKSFILMEDFINLESLSGIYFKK